MGVSAGVGVGVGAEAEVEVGAGATRLESYLKFRKGVSGGGRGFGEESTSGLETGCKTAERFLEK